MKVFDTADSLGEPYPGLRPFRRDETHIFFGRETTIDDMIERLAAHHFLTVTGLSGSGKSSLVRTGLLDVLDRGLLIEAGSTWRIADFRPGGEPLARLAEALLEAAGATASAERQALTEAKLARGPLGLVRLLDEIEFPARTNLLVLVDQFEEIFRYRHGEASDDADAFVAMLLAGAKQRRRPVYVVITMRSDFLGDCAQFSGLAETINEGQFHTPRLTREQCRQAIEEPARVYGGEVEDALVTRLLNDMGGNPDQLPLLQHALMLLWQRACERAGDAPPLLTLADYESLGGVGTVGSEGDASREAQNRTSNGALSDHADRVLAELTSEQQRLAAILFRALTESEGASDRAVRRPVSLANAAEIADVPIGDLIPVIEAFRAPGRNFLTPLAPESLKPETIIDISHESLIRQWVKLRQWVQEEYQSAETYRGIERSAKQWRNGLGNLLTSLDLAQALNWHKTERPNATWAGRYGGSFGNVTGFLHASERHRLWRRGLAAAAIGVPLVLVAGALWMMFYGITMVLATLAFMNPARENADFGIQPQRILKQENIGSQTPKTIPGGQVINTLALRAALAGGTIGGSPFVLIDAWDFNHETIPKAERIPFAGSKGNFQDDTQHQLEDKLKTLTGNKPDTPLVFFCQGVECWESYNACLRAISLGYSQVYWYRGGLASWMAADETFAKEAASELANFDLSKIQIKMTTVFSNIPTIALVVKRMFVQTGQESQRVQASQPDYYSRSIADADRGNYDEAIVDLNRAIAHTPANAEAYYRRGRAFAMKGDYNDAMPDFLKAVELDPAKNAEVQTILLDQKYAGAYCQRGSNYHDRGDFDRAISDYDQAIRLDPKYAPAYGGRGKSYYNKRDYVHAFADFDVAIGIDSKNVEAYEIRAAAYSDKGDYDRAIGDYDQAIRLDPKNVPTYVNRGNAYFNERDYTRAITDYDQATQLDPNNVPAYINRANAYSNKRDYARAITDYDQAIQLDPKNVPAYINRANAYSNKRDYAHAFIDYDQAIQLDPKNANAYNERCWARVIAGQELERALSDCNESLRIQPNNANTLDSRGSAYLKLHRLDEAIADFNAALAIEPKFASSLYGRGLAKLKNGDRVSADADMAAAKAIQADIAEKKARDNIE